MVWLNTHRSKKIFFNVDPLKLTLLKKPTLSKELVTIFDLEKSVSDKMVFMNLHFEKVDHNGIHYDFKLDRGIKPGDTIKIILSLTFGDGDGDGVGANVILIPILNIVSLTTRLAPLGPNMHNYMLRFCAPNTDPRNDLTALSIYDLIARIRLYANQEAFGALIEPTDVEKALMVCFFHDKNRDELISFI